MNSSDIVFIFKANRDTCKTALGVHVESFVAYIRISFWEIHKWYFPKYPNTDSSIL